MTNLERLKLELAHKSYFTDEEYIVLLDENGLVANDTYNKATNQLELLQTVISILQALTNNIDLYRNIETEFTTTSSAYKNINDRIDELNKRIAQMPSYEPTAQTITYLFYN